ncbi:SPASM domain-containing protein [uncultured Cloacibacillus sp.]|uniref:SPASM domain-containing protein n=1 Tax=uncultured Cloacibacillus sp. TaxID=889794 RepID=UPI0034C63C41
MFGRKDYYLLFSLLYVFLCVLLDIPIGNIRENSFSTIWLNSPILEELNNRQKYSEPCVQCIYVEKCGGCRGVAYGSFGDFFAPDPHCWLDSNGERL